MPCKPCPQLSFNLHICRTLHVQIGNIPLRVCSYLEERSAGGGLPLWRCRMEAASYPTPCQGRIQWPAGLPHSRLRVCGVTLPAGSTLQQVLGRLLPPCGISLGGLEVDRCRFTPAQCSNCLALEGLSDMKVCWLRCLPDNFTAADVEELSSNGRPMRPLGGSPADLARKAAAEAVLAALMAQVPQLERLDLDAELPEGCGVPACVVQCASLRYLDLGFDLTTLPPGPYLHSEWWICFAKLKDSLPAHAAAAAVVVEPAPPRWLYRCCLSSLPGRAVPLPSHPPLPPPPI